MRRDASFYKNLILKQEHGVDSEAVRQYFPLDHVVSTTMEIYQVRGPPAPA